MASSAWCGCAVRLRAQVRLLVRAPRGAAERRGGRPATRRVLGRREVLQQFALVGAAAPFAVSLSGVPLSYDFRVEERELALPGWPRGLDGLRVVHLSDIHVGGAMNRERLREVAALTNAARPDLVLHTGDFLTHRSGDFDAPLYEALARMRAAARPVGLPRQPRLRRPRAAGAAPARRRRRRRCATRSCSLRVDGQPLEIAGLDFVFDRGDRAATLRRRDRAAGRRAPARRACCSTTTRARFAALPDGCADLVLSGHTHGGHIGVQLGRDHALTVVGLVGLPDQGVFARGAMRLFVTRCVGFYGYPMRVGIPPEIAVLVLRRRGLTARSER